MCIIHKDGLKYAFTHRSFQEYFAAKFICNAKPAITKKILDDTIGLYGKDNVILLSLAINREKIETDWLLEKLSDLIIELKPYVDSENIAGFYSVLFDGIDFGVSSKGLRIGLNSANAHLYMLIFNEYKITEEHRKSLIGESVDQDEQARINRQKDDFFIAAKHLEPELIDAAEDHHNVHLRLTGSPVEWLHQTSLADDYKEIYTSLTKTKLKLEEKSKKQDQSLLEFLDNSE